MVSLDTIVLCSEANDEGESSNYGEAINEGHAHEILLRSYGKAIEEIISFYGCLIIKNSKILPPGNNTINCQTNHK